MYTHRRLISLIIVTSVAVGSVAAESEYWLPMSSWDGSSVVVTETVQGRTGVASGHAAVGLRSPLTSTAAARDRTGLSSSAFPSPTTDFAEQYASSLTVRGQEEVQEGQFTRLAEQEDASGIGGWASWGIYDNSHGINGRTGNLPLGFNNLAQEFQLNQAWLYATRVAETGNGFDWGYRMDVLWGSDGPDTAAFGDESWDVKWNTSKTYGFAMPQLYFELAFDRLDIIIGHFYTIIGYEVVQAPDNFFYSHALAFYYHEPFTHTGVLGNYALNDKWKVYGGWTAGWDTGFSNGNNGSTFLGGVEWTPMDEFSFFYATSFGDPGDNPVMTSSTFIQSIVMDFKFIDDWEYVFWSDFQTRDSDTLGGKSYGITQYLYYTLNERTTLGARYEWFRDGRGVNGLAGASEHFHNVTFGLNRFTRLGIVFRPEVRCDWAARDRGFAGGAFANGTQQDQVTWGLNGYCTF